MNVTISFEPSINFSPSVVPVLTLQNFANSGVLSPDFETIRYGDSLVRKVNCIQKYFVTTSFENKLLMAKGQTEFCLQQFLIAI